MRKLSLKIIAQSTFILACVAFLLNWLLSNWTIVQSAWTTISWPAIAASFVLLAVSFLFLPSSMVLFMRAYEAPVSYLQGGRAFYGSQLAKYLPGGIWVFPSRLVMMKEMGFDLSLTTMALGFEMVTLLISSLLVSWATLERAMGHIWPVGLQALVVVGSVAAAIISIMAPELFEVGQRVVGRLADEQPKILQSIQAVPVSTRFSLLFVSILIYVVMWLLAGFSFYLLLAAMTSPVGWQMIPLTVGVFTFAWLVGFVSVFTPGGVGVREGVIVLLLGTIISSPYLVLVALFSRILWSLAELFFLVIFILSWRKQ